MKKSERSIDGFVPRRAGNQLGGREAGEIITDEASMVRPLRTDAASARKLGEPSQPIMSTKSDIDDSLRGIDDGGSPEKRKRFSRKKGRNKKPLSKKKRIIKWTAIALGVVILAVAGYLAAHVLLRGGNVFQGSIIDIIQNEPLQEDENGRSNFLILGTSEDDPGHGGAYLTDSMMVVSVDQTKKNAFMVSIPRDLYVQYGMACNSGYAGKINEYFLCVNQDFESEEAETERLDATRAFVGDILGIDIQYAVHVNHTVIKDAVDAVDGIDVDIQGSNGDPGVLDRNFDWRCNYTCYLVRYDNGVHHLDGEHALFLSMARGDIAPTYGLGNSNFDREKNQQKIILALKEKALTSGTLTNIGKVTGLIDALGDNLRTNIQTKEVRTIMSLAADIPESSIYRLSLFDGDDRLVTTGLYGGASVVMPAAGIFNYADIQAFIHKKFTADAVGLEGATVVVLNGSGVYGAAQATADELDTLGLDVVLTSNAPDNISETYKVYAIDTSKKATIAALEEKLGVQVIEGEPDFTVATDADIIVVVGPSAGE